MPLLAVNNLKKMFATRLLFDGVSFEVDAGDHIGLIGVNGCGKSTLFRILVDKEGCDSGEIYMSHGTVIGTIDQSIGLDDASLYEYVLSVFEPVMETERELELVNDMLLAASNAEPELIDRQHKLRERFEDIGGLTFRARTKSTLIGLGFAEAELGKKMRFFSGGQRNKAQLARMLLSGANLLLLDEPTNHLDIKAIEWLEEFLSSYRGAFIVISHDRYFLDKVTNRTMELKDCKLYCSKGNYSRHMELRSTDRELKLRQYLRTKREIKRIEGIVEQQKRWGQERNYVTAAHKQKSVDRLKATLVEPERDPAAIHFAFTAKEGGGNDVVVAKGLSKSFDGREIFGSLDMLVKKGERVFILGDNGCGKTTLLNILAGKIRPTSGAFCLGSHIEAAYYEQNMTSLNPQNTVLEEVWDKYFTTTSHRDIRNALGAFLFRGDDVEKKIEMLSGGELARIQLLKLMLTRANLLFLDEPTNHLDIPSREALENALEEYNGTIVAVTHDRYLVNRLADRILHMEAKGFAEYIGGYDDYVEAIRFQKNTVSSDLQPSSGALEYREKKALQSELNKAKTAVARCEKKISETEAELERLNEEIALPEVVANYVKVCELSKHVDEVTAKLEQLYKEWEEAAERLNSLIER